MGENVSVHARNTVKTLGPFRKNNKFQVHHVYDGTFWPAIFSRMMTLFETWKEFQNLKTRT